MVDSDFRVTYNTYTTIDNVHRYNTIYTRPSWNEVYTVPVRIYVYCIGEGVVFPLLRYYFIVKQTRIHENCGF